MKNIFTIFFATLLFIGCDKPGNGPATPTASVSSIDCAGATVSTAATAGISFSGTANVPYTGGNGGVYPAGASLTSTGVTGLTATLQGGSLSNGSGSFIYSISGTPNTSGTATFNIAFSGMSCTFVVNVAEAPMVQYGTPFANVPDRQDVTMYQVNMRAFSTQGNLQGVTARLDDIKSLGVNVIYLMPIFPVGAVNSVNSPYSISNYTAIGNEFGTLNDLRTLVDGAHTRNMSVMLDWVANHTAWDHPWIAAHKDWYMQNAAGNIISPPGTGWNDVAQLNFSNAAMRLEMIKSMKYWVYAANIDGFRFDYADGPPSDFWKQAIDTLRNITTHKLLLLAEGNRSNHFTVGFDFTFGFSFYGQLKNIMNNNQAVTGIDGLNTTEYTNAANGQQVVRYLSNHDVNGSDGTPLELFGGVKGSMAAFVVVALMKSVPMIYNGQEVGFPTRITFPFTGTKINWTLNPAITAEYKTVIAIRNSSNAIRRGQLTSYTNNDVCAFTKELGTEKVFVVSNLRNATINYTLPGAVANSTWTDMSTNGAVSLTTQLTLPPYAYIILKK